MGAIRYIAGGMVSCTACRAASHPSKDWLSAREAWRNGCLGLRILIMISKVLGFGWAMISSLTITNPTTANIGMIIQTAQNKVSTTELESSVVSPSLFTSIAATELVTSIAPKLKEK